MSTLPDIGMPEFVQFVVNKDGFTQRRKVRKGRKEKKANSFCELCVLCSFA
jgi:hypothetical protein